MMGRRELRRKIGHLLPPTDPLFGAQTTIFDLGDGRKVRAEKGPGCRLWTLTWSPGGEAVAGSGGLTSKTAVQGFLRNLLKAGAK